MKLEAREKIELLVAIRNEREALTNLLSETTDDNFRKFAEDSLSALSSMETKLNHIWETE